MFRTLAAAPLLLAAALLAACPAEETAECGDGETRCGGVCVETATDPEHCGGCAQPCGEGTCSGGVCTCDASATECPGEWPRCVDTLNDPENCGACGYACPLTGAVCVGGGCQCPGSLPTECPVGAPTACVNLDTDPLNCGACGAVCPLANDVCVLGGCTCPDSLPDACPAACVDFSSDESNCGDCGLACRPGEACGGGACACLPGYSDCTTACYDLEADEANCGSCGHACPTGATCTPAGCDCPGSQTLCAGSPDVCADLATDEAHCGTCSNACTTGQVCTAGTCCAAGQLVCGSTTKSCCDGTACCADGSCQKKHSNGLGGFYWDCSPLGAPWTYADAVLAADAWAVGGAVDMALTACPTNCYGRISTASGRCAIWCFDGSSFPGRVNEDTLCICPTDLDPTWN